MGSYSVPSHVHHRAVHDEVVIMDVRTDSYLGLNPTAAVAWTRLVEGGSADDAGAALSARFDVSPGQAERDVTTLVDDLVRRGLLQQTDGEVPAQAP